MSSLYPLTTIHPFFNPEICNKITATALGKTPYSAFRVTIRFARPNLDNTTVTTDGHSNKPHDQKTTSSHSDRQPRPLSQPAISIPPAQRRCRNIHGVHDHCRHLIIHGGMHAELRLHVHTIIDNAVNATVYITMRTIPQTHFTTTIWRMKRRNLYILIVAHDELKSPRNEHDR